MRYSTRISGCLVLLTWFCLATPALGQRSPRTWTSGDGKFTTRAVLLEQVDQSVRLRKDDGKVVVVPLDQLSAADQAYVRGEGNESLDGYCIRLVYFVPTDREPVPAYEDRIRVVMAFVSEMYLQSLKSYKLESKGLQFQIRDDKVVVHLVRGKRPASYYSGAPKYDDQQQFKRVLNEIPSEIGTQTENVIVAFTETYDLGPTKKEWAGGVALGGRYSSVGGVGIFSAWILRKELCATSVRMQRRMLFDATPIQGRVAVGHGGLNSPRFEFIEDGIGAVAHELGHAFGLAHDHRKDGQYIMGNGFRELRWNFASKPRPGAIFSRENAHLLHSSRYIASDLDLSDNSPPECKLVLPTTTSVRASALNVELQASDDAGLRYVLFFSPEQDSVVGGRKLSGKQQEFSIRLPIKPTKNGKFSIVAFVTDIGGNLKRVTASTIVQ